MTTTDQANQAGATAQHSRRGAHPGLALLIIAGTQLVIVLDATIVNIALPSMGHYFNKSQTDMTWAINAYTLAFGGLLLLGGKAGDILGRRRMFMVGLTLFTVGSFMGGIAQNFEMLMIGRIIQGVGGAIASPTALALITTEFEEGKERTRALAVFSAVAGAGAALGLMLGGILTEYLTWRWVLFVNVPIGILLVLGAWVYLHESDRQTGRFDWLGGFLSTVGMTALVYGFIHAASHGWRDSQTIASFTVALVLLVSFVFLESRLSYAMMPLHVFSNRSRSGAYIVMLVIGAAMFGMFYFLTFFVQQNLGFSALKSGFAFLPVAVVIGISAQLAAKFMTRFGPRNLIIGGATIMTGGLLWLSTIDATSKYWNHILPSMIVMAFGIGMIFVPLMTVVVTGVEPHEAGLASALLNVGQQVGGSIGLSVLATVAASTGKSYFNSHAHVISDKLHQLAPNGPAQSGSGSKDPNQLLASLPEQLRGPIGAVIHDLTQATQAHAAAMGFLTAAIFGMVAIIAAVTMITTGKADVANINAEPVAVA